MKDVFDSNRLNRITGRKAVGCPNWAVSPISEVVYRQLLLSMEDSSAKVQTEREPVNSRRDKAPPQTPAQAPLSLQLD